MEAGTTETTREPTHMYLIESMKHTTSQHKNWWRPNKLGYTTYVSEAGRYPKEEAEAICKKSNIIGYCSRPWAEPEVLRGRAGVVRHDRVEV